MTKVLKLDTINGMHEQLELPTDRYGIVVELVNIKSMFKLDSEVDNVYSTLTAGVLELNSIRYSDTTKVDDSVVIDTTNIEVRAYEVDTTSITNGFAPVDGLKPYVLVVVTDDEFVSNYKMDSITVVDVNGVLKVDIIVNPIYPLTDRIPTEINKVIFKLAFLPFDSFINNNYHIVYDENSLDSILATRMLLSNRGDVTNINIIDINKAKPTDSSTHILVEVDSDGNVSINSSPYMNALDVIKDACEAYNIPFMASDYMLEIDSIIRNEAGFSDIRRILTDVISTEDGKEGFIKNTIPLVLNGGYGKFSTFFKSELLEIAVRKKIAKEILTSAQIAHSDYYTVTIIDSNILIPEIVEAICEKENEQLSEDHVYVIMSNHTEFSTINYFTFNNEVIADLFEKNIEIDFDVVILDDSDFINPVIVDITTALYTNSKDLGDINLVGHVLTPRYCKIEKSL
jgi:hypothetical protein